MMMTVMPTATSEIQECMKIPMKAINDNDDDLDGNQGVNDPTDNDFTRSLLIVTLVLISTVSSSP